MENHKLQHLLSNSDSFRIIWVKECVCTLCFQKISTIIAGTKHWKINQKFELKAVSAGNFFPSLASPSFFIGHITTTKLMSCNKGKSCFMSKKNRPWNTSTSSWCQMSSVNFNTSSGKGNEAIMHALWQCCITNNYHIFNLNIFKTVKTKICSIVLFQWGIKVVTKLLFVSFTYPSLFFFCSQWCDNRHSYFDCDLNWQRCSHLFISRFKYSYSLPIWEALIFLIRTVV